MMEVMNSNMEVSKYKPSILKNYLIKNTDLDIKECDLISKNITKQIYNKFENIISTDVLKSLVLNNLIKRNRINEVNNNTVLGLTVKEFEELNKNGCKDNANLGYSPSQVEKYTYDAVAKKYALEIMPKKSKEFYLKNYIHHHDLESYMNKPNCFNIDLRFIARNGLVLDGSGDNCCVAKPAKTFKVLLNHMLQLLMGLSQVFSGGLGYVNFNTLLAPFVRGMDYKDIYQELEGFIFNCNMSLVSKGGQTIFSSIGIDLSCPKPLENVEAILPSGIIDGTTYKDYKAEADIIFKIICEIISKGDANGKYFRYPNCCFNIREGDLDNYESNCKLLHELGANNPTIYYVNCVDEEKAIMGCFSGKEKLLIKKEDNIKIYTFDELISEYTNNEYGVINVDDKNLYVQSIDDNHNIIWTKVHNLIHNPPQTLYKVYLKNGRSFVCDKNHTLITPNLERINCLKSIGEDILTINSMYTIDTGTVTAIKLYDYADSYCVEANDRVIIGDNRFNFILTGNCRTANVCNYTGDYFNDCVNTGNFMYSTINLPLLDLETNSIEEFYNLLDECCEVVYETLIHRRQTIIDIHNNNIALILNWRDNESGEKFYNIDNTSLSIGYCGLSELLKQNKDLDGVEVIDFINNKKDEFYNRDGLRWAVIGSPAESTAWKFGKYNKNKYPNEAIVNGSEGNYYLTNSHHINVAEGSIGEHIDNASVYHKINKGGCILHIWLNEAFSDAKAFWRLNKKIINKDVQFWDYTKTFSYCNNCGFKINSDIDTCIVCESKDISKSTRITGYYLDIRTFNDGKIAENNDRNYQVL